MVSGPSFQVLNWEKNLESRKITHYLYGVLAGTTKRTYHAGKSQDYTLKPHVKNRFSTGSQLNYMW